MVFGTTCVGIGAEISQIGKRMKIAVIDIGSNSVRLMIWADGTTLYKKICTTRLGEGLAVFKKLQAAAIERSVAAVSEFVSAAHSEGADSIYAFATAAVRRAENRREFLAAVQKRCDLSVDVVSGELEAKLGFAGALAGSDGGIIDIGGASTEITVGTGGVIRYAKSIDVGTVRLKDLCGSDRNRLDAVISEKICGYGKIPQIEMTAICGTATTLASLKRKMTVYDPKLIHGTVLSKDEIKNLAECLLSATQKERLAMPGMEAGRADVIGGGALLLAHILDRIGTGRITVSEKDNMEGYLLYKTEHKGL